LHENAEKTFSEFDCEQTRLPALWTALADKSKQQRWHLTSSLARHMSHSPWPAQLQCLYNHFQVKGEVISTKFTYFKDVNGFKSAISFSESAAIFLEILLHLKLQVESWKVGKLA
jgi:hypothetical protein